MLTSCFCVTFGSFSQYFKLFHYQRWWSAIRGFGGTVVIVLGHPDKMENLIDKCYMCSGCCPSLPPLRPPSLRHSTEIMAINNHTVATKCSSARKSPCHIQSEARDDQAQWGRQVKAETGKNLGFLCQTASQFVKAEEQVLEETESAPGSTQMIRKWAALLLIWRRLQWSG